MEGDAERLTEMDDKVADDLPESGARHALPSTYGKMPSSRRSAFTKKKSQDALSMQAAASYGRTTSFGPTASFGSTVTDYDGFIHPSAQAELDDMERRREFLRKRDRARAVTQSFGSSGGGELTFGSTVTDFDNVTSLGAQAEHDEEYVSRIAAGQSAFLQMKGIGKGALGAPTMPPPMAMPGMPPMGMPAMPAMGMPGVPYPGFGMPGFPTWPGYAMPGFDMGMMPNGIPNGKPPKGIDAAQLSAQAANLEEIAAQYREAARQAEQGAAGSSHEGGKGKGRGRGKNGSAESSMRADQNTTLMVKNLPNDYTRDMVLELLDEKGFKGKYDFIYVPVDFKRWAGLGYAFVNMVTHTDAIDLQKALSGHATWKKMSSKVCEVAWGEPFQGLDAHIQRYRNSPVMHPDVPDEAKPVIFYQGVRQDFPPPTKRIQAPRLKR